MQVKTTISFILVIVHLLQLCIIVYHVRDFSATTHFVNTMGVPKVTINHHYFVQPLPWLHKHIWHHMIDSTIHLHAHYEGEIFVTVSELLQGVNNIFLQLQ